MESLKKTKKELEKQAAEVGREISRRLTKATTDSDLEELEPEWFNLLEDYEV